MLVLQMLQILFTLVMSESVHLVETILVNLIYILYILLRGVVIRNRLVISLRNLLLVSSKVCQSLKRMRLVLRIVTRKSSRIHGT